MGGVHLDQIEADAGGPAGGGAERVAHRVEVIEVHRVGRRGDVLVAVGARPHRFPTTLIRLDVPAAGRPGAGVRGLPTRMGELHAER